MPSPLSDHFSLWVDGPWFWCWFGGVESLRLFVLKLCLFPQLLSGRYRDTQTSITDSSALYRVSQDKVSAHSALAAAFSCSPC